MLILKILGYLVRRPYVWLWALELPWHLRIKCMKPWCPENGVRTSVFCEHHRGWGDG